MPQKMIQGIYHFHSKEGNNMNKIYKVIWSKAKHTYVVASEIAKGHTKGETTGKGLKKLAAAMLVAAALLSPSFAWAADATTKFEPAANQASNTAVAVYTKDEADRTFATQDQLQNDVAATNELLTKKADQTALDETNTNLAKKADQTALDETNANLAKKADQTALDETNANLAKKADQTALDATNANLAKKADQTALDETNANLAKKANQVDLDGKADKATTLKGYGITNAYTKDEADGKFATVDQLQADVAATNEELAKKADKATTLEGYGITDAYTKTEVDNKVDAEKTARESADSALGSRTSALEAKTGSLNRVAAANSTSINESMTLKDKQYSATLQVNGSGAQIGVVNNSAAGLANDGGTAYTEYRARTGAILSKATNDISSTSSNGQVVDTAGDTTGEYSQVATAKSTGTTFTYSNDGGKTSTSTTIKGDSVSTGTVSATAGIIDETTTNGTSVKASQTVGQNLNALDERITNVKEYVLSETVSKTDAAVQDGAIVKAANTIGDNVTKLDAALAKETAARLGADAAQDKVIQTVNDNLVSSVNTINKNMADGFKALSQADANELAGRVAADTELVKATNGGLALNDKNVLQKNETTIAEDGTVTTKTTAADTLIMNEGKKNQITLSENGIKVGTGSTVIASDGVFAGGDTADQAKAALNADGSIKGANGDFAVDKDGNVTSKATITGEIVTDGKGASMSNGTVTGKTLTDGIATLQNGNLNTTGNVNAHDIVATGDISGKAITGTSLNTQGGAINGGAITGTSIYGTTGTFGSLTTTSNASVGGKLTANGITNTGNVITDTLTVNHNATVGGDLGVTGDITGKSLNVGTGDIKGGRITGTGLDVGAGTIKTTGAVETGTLTTTGDATIGGNLTVDKNLTVNGEFNAKTLSSRLDENNYTTINGGKTESVNLKIDVKTHETQASASTFDETGSNAWAKDDDSIGESSMTADKISQSLSDTGDHPKNIASRELSQNTDNKYEITDSVVEGNQSNVENRTADTTDSQISLKDDSSKVLNKSYITQNLKKVLMGVEEGDNKTTIEQDANNITNTAENGTITNTAKDLVNTASENMTNNVGKDLTTTVGGEMKITVTGDVTEDYKANLSTTVGGNQTTTVTGDSSLTAENINNEAKNKIINKALDVETDAKSSIVNKVSNEYGSNTSTQLSYETKEEMSQADGKTASYLRGAAEEKSQLTDGDKKTTIDTIAGQTNTNITDGKNISNNLQNADKIASSVTDGKSTTVVDQKAGSLASSITNGTKANNTSSTVDKSEQLIKASDTQYSATKKTATKTEDALVNGSSVIDVIKNLDDAANPVISSAVTDGTNTTGVTQTATDITNAAQNGTIANAAKNIINNASENMTNTVGKDLTTTVGGEMKTTVTGKTTEAYNGGLETTVTGEEKHTVNGNQTSIITGTQTTTVTGDVTEDYKANLSTTVGGNQTTTVTGDSSLSAKNITNTATNSITNKVGDNVSSSMTTNTITESVKDGTKDNTFTKTAEKDINVVKDGAKSNTFTKTADKDINVVTDGTNTSTESQLADSVNTSLKEVDAEGKTTQSLSNVKTVSDDTTKITDTTKNAFSSSSQKADSITTTVKDTKTGTISERSQTVSQVQDKVGTTTVTTTDGLTKLTNEAGTHNTQMDFAEVLKDLGVRGNATVDGNTTLGKEGADTTLTVNSTSTFNKDVTMKSNATVEKDLTVKGTTTTDKLVVSNGATVTGGTTTDKLHVTSTSQFDGAATFKDIVTMEKDLNVGGNAKVAGDVTAKSFKVGENTYIDENGINANNKVIKNVGQGDISANSTDAVSGGQLYETNTRVSGLETRMGTVETKVDKLDNKIDKVGANAAAMANLHPLEFDEDSKWNIAAAVGSSGSETASAVGVFYRPNENVMVNASAAMGTGENMFGGGVSLRLGHGGNKAKEAQMKAAAKENRELRAKVDDLTARMDALLSVLNPNMSKDFPDVPENHWAYEAVSRLAGNGIVEGYEDGKYHGERQMTRYEMAEIIYNALSKGAKAEKKLVEEFRPELQAMAAQKKA